mmetsp:Transcript_29028/g.79660  ORF Transcript_29028/g.79660 Transcript_29028/m.79660 type:complete len:520 (+) Transcript_29028:112-1671(+)
MGTYEQCAVETEGGGNELLLQCITEAIERKDASKTTDYTTWLLVLCGALIFFMQAGFAMLCAGCVRKKNVQNTMLKNLLDACGASLAFYCCGYAFAFGGQNDDDSITFIGRKNFFSLGDVDQGFWFFQFAFSATAVTIVAGTLAERCQMAAYLCYSIFLTGFVYPIVAHSIWSNNGFLSAFSKDPFRGIGTIDFAGSGVVHLTGGATALIATYILGARKGRFHDNRGRLLPTPRTIHGHSIALQLMGTMVLWFGWYGFNPGSALLLGVENTGKVAARAAVNTSLSAASGACSALFTNLYIQERKTGEQKFDLSKAMNGALGALVAITAPCGTVQNWASILIGVVAGLLYLFGSNLLIQVRLDDAVDAIPVHCFNGIWGLIATGLFSSPGPMLDAFGTDEHVGWFYSLGRGSFDATLLGNQILATGFIFGWVTCTMWPFFLTLNYLGWFRADSLEELVGLDLSYMGNRQNLIENGDDEYSDVGSVGGNTEDGDSIAKEDKEQAKAVVIPPDAMSELTPGA